MRFQERRERSRVRTALSGLSDWELHDIGIARGKIEHVVMNRSIDSRGARSENRQSSCIVWAIRVPPMRGTAGAEKWPKSAAPKNKFRQPIQSDLGRPDRCSKINRFSFPPNQSHLRANPPHEEGRTRRHDTWSAGSGGRDGVARARYCRAALTYVLRP